MFNFELHHAPITAETLVAMIFAVIIFIVVPVILAIVEYRATKKNRKHGFYIMIGTFASALLLGWYSLLVGLLIEIVYWWSSSKYRMTNSAI
mgnify:CR=1 FL=1